MITVIINTTIGDIVIDMMVMMMIMVVVLVMVMMIIMKLSFGIIALNTVANLNRILFFFFLWTVSC